MSRQTQGYIAWVRTSALGSRVVWMPFRSLHEGAGWIKILFKSHGVLRMSNLAQKFDAIPTGETRHFGDATKCLISVKRIG